MIAWAGSMPLRRPSWLRCDLGLQVVDVVEQDLVEVADGRVEVAGDGDVEDQGQAVASGALDALVERPVDDRLLGGGGADDQVGLDQRLAELVEGHGAAAPAGGGGLGPLGAAVGHEDAARSQGGEVLQGQVAHLAGADDQHGLVAEGVEDLAGDVHRDAGDRELAAVHAGLLADELADPDRLLEDLVEDRPDGLAAIGRLVGVADLAEDLPLAEHQALQAGGDAEQVADGRLVVVGDQVRRHQLRGDLVEISQEIGEVGDPGQSSSRPSTRRTARPGCRSRR